ncbi:MAG: hypothetical protein LC772_04860, partial [Chloroflexi bacterium]|nr:hypothetical protein [Chloroflexota bacterium]
IFELARRIPPEPGERCLYDPEQNIARRETTQGTLVAAALPLERTLLLQKMLPSDRRLQVLVVRAGDRLLLTSIASGKVVVPTIAPAVRVTAVTHDGFRFPVHFDSLRGATSFMVLDAAGPVAYYRIDMRKTPVQPREREDRPWSFALPAT